MRFRFKDTYVAIRPEGFKLNNTYGVLTLDVKEIITMGKDKTLICEHPLKIEGSIKVIIDSDGNDQYILGREDYLSTCK